MMTNFIEELFYGNIDPQARGYRYGFLFYPSKICTHFDFLRQVKSFHIEKANIQTSFSYFRHVNLV